MTGPQALKGLLYLQILTWRGSRVNMEEKDLPWQALLALHKREKHQIKRALIQTESIFKKAYMIDHMSINIPGYQRS